MLEATVFHLFSIPFCEYIMIFFLLIIVLGLNFLSYYVKPILFLGKIYKKERGVILQWSNYLKLLWIVKENRKC